MASILEHLKKKILMSPSDKNVKNQSTISSHSNEDTLRDSSQFKVQNIISRMLRDRKPTKEIESSVTSSLEEKSRGSFIQERNNVSDELYKVSLKEKLPGLDHEIKSCNSYAQKTKYGSLIQESTFDSLPDGIFITAEPPKPIYNIALFVSFNYDLSNHLLREECNAHGFHPLFHDTQDHVNFAPIVKLVTDVVVNCWTHNCNITVFITSEPGLHIGVVTALLNLLRVHFDRKTLKIVVIWLGVHKESRSWIDEKCRAAKVTGCIQGVGIADIVPQIMSMFDNVNDL